MLIDIHLESSSTTRTPPLMQQGGCVFEKDDTVASLSSIFKWSKASFAREGGIVAFVNKYKQVHIITCQ